MLVPTLHCDLSAPGNDGKRHTKVPFSSVVLRAVEVGGAGVVVVVTGAFVVVVVEVEVVVDVDVVLDAGTVVVVEVVVVVVTLVGCRSSRGR